MEVPPSEVSLRAESLRVTRNFRVAGPLRVMALTDHPHRQIDQRTMVLWLLESFPALILVLSFIRFSFGFRRWILLGHDLTSRDRHMPLEG
jgi:hypothetical protein